MSDKELVLDLVKRLPDDADLKQIQEEIEFLAAIRQGEEEADRGEVIPHDRIKEDFRSWTSK
jgi:predicted transcriptional regulator